MQRYCTIEAKDLPQIFRVESLELVLQVFHRDFSFHFVAKCSQTLLHRLRSSLVRPDVYTTRTPLQSGKCRSQSGAEMNKSHTLKYCRVIATHLHRISRYVFNTELVLALQVFQSTADRF